MMTKLITSVTILINGYNMKYIVLFMCLFVMSCSPKPNCNPENALGENTSYYQEESKPFEWYQVLSIYLLVGWVTYSSKVV